MPAMRDRITTSQLAVLTTSTMVGVGYLSLPRLLADHAGRDGWLSLLAGGAVLAGVVAVMVALGRRFPGQTVYDYSRAVLGRWPGGAYNLLLITYYSLAAAWVVRVFGDVLKVYLLERTPLEVLVITMLFTGAYLLGHGLNALARLQQAFFPLLLAPIVLVLALAQMQADYSELLPVLQDGWQGLLLAVPESFRALTGFGVVAFAMPFLRRPEKALPAALAGLGFTLCIYLGLFVVCVAVLGADVLPRLMFPVVDLARSIDVPGAFLERVEILFLSLWVITTFNVFSSLSYFALLGLSTTLGFREHRHLVYLYLPLTYVIALRPGNIVATIRLSEVFSYLGFTAILGLLGIYLLALVRRQRGDAGSAAGEKD